MKNPSPHKSTSSMKHVSLERAAQTVGVSSATLRNWVKAGHIKPVSTRPVVTV
jgi:transposase-like protein